MVQTSPALYRNANFVLLWTGQFISQVGDRLAMVAFPWLIYGSTHHSAFSTGAMFALYTLPYVLFGTVAGAFIDRLDKRRVMVAADVARAGLVLAVPFVADQSLAGVYVLAFVISSVAVFFDPCKLAILPDLVTKDKLIRANSLLATGETLTETVGYALAGFIVYYLARKVVFGIDAGNVRGLGAGAAGDAVCSAAEAGGRADGARTSAVRCARASRSCVTMPACWPTRSWWWPRSSASAPCTPSHSCSP